MFCVIMAGGSGTRFWPASRQSRPKQFLPVSGRDPMVLETCNRLGSVCRDEDMLLVIGREHRSITEALLEGTDIHVLAEPVGRNTAPCVGLGALFARYRGHRGAVAFLPADHHISRIPPFLEALDLAGVTAETEGGIVTLGIVPTRPETGYGYIRRGETLGDGEKFYSRVSAFVEKPDAETAARYSASGDYFWNAGIFVSTADTILNEIRIHLPDLHDGLLILDRALGTDGFESALRAVYRDLKAVSFDVGIMEATKTSLFVVPCDCGWSDVGSWSSLYELREGEWDPDDNLVEGDAALIDCVKSYVSEGSGRFVACLGLEHCLIVDTPDALLIADLRKPQDLRKIVAYLKERSREGLL